MTDTRQDSFTGSTCGAVKPARKRRKPDWYSFSNVCTESNNIELSELSLEEAFQSQEKEYWLRAVQEELQCFDNNSAWEKRKKVIVKITFVIVPGLQKDIAKRVIYNETLYPVVYTTLRLLIALQLDLDAAHLDVKTAFLN